MAADISAFHGKRILVTGGLGFIGSNLAHALAGHCAELTLVDSLIPQYGGNRFNLSGIEDKVRVNIADVRDESLDGPPRPRPGFHFQPRRTGQPH